MVRHINVLQELKKPTKGAIKEITGDLMTSCNDCRHALSLSHGVYCALQREKIDMDTCDGCLHFAPEPSEYSLFRRM